MPLNAKRGPFEEWFRDQHMISINLYKWLKQAKADCRRSDFMANRIRWDRVGWPGHKSKDEWLSGTDAHLPLPGHIEEHFKAVHELAQIMAGDALNVTVYWHTYMTKMGAQIPSLEKVIADLSKPMSGGGYLHKPDLSG